MESFEFDKTYVFDRDRYIEDEKNDDSIDAREMYEFNDATRAWVDRLHGKEVTLISEVLGTVSMYNDIPISINWCKIKE